MASLCHPVDLDQLVDRFRLNSPQLTNASLGPTRAEYVVPSRDPLQLETASAQLLLILIRRQIKMLLMWLVFTAYGTSKQDQHKWLPHEARRHDAVTLARAYWNRASRHDGNVARRKALSHLDDASVRSGEPRMPAA